MRRWAFIVVVSGLAAGLGQGLLNAEDTNRVLTDTLTQSNPSARYGSGLGVATQQIFGPAPSTDTSVAGYETLTPGSYYYTEEPPATEESKKVSTRRSKPQTRSQPFRYDELQP